MKASKGGENAKFKAEQTRLEKRLLQHAEDLQKAHEEARRKCSKDFHASTIRGGVHEPMRDVPAPRGTAGEQVRIAAIHGVQDIRRDPNYDNIPKTAPPKGKGKGGGGKSSSSGSGWQPRWGARWGRDDWNNRDWRGNGGGREPYSRGGRGDGRRW